MSDASTTSVLILAREDRLACRAWIQKHSKSFFLSSLLLPARVRQAAWALYAFCRRADDAVDETRTHGLEQVAQLRLRLTRVYRGVADDHPIDRAFSKVVEAHAIPEALPAALLDGMEMDARDQVYETDDDLFLYCFRVAATVGLMMTKVMGVADDRAYYRAADLGIAMQLTNIARDIGEDAARGRVYLPRTLCESVGLQKATLLNARAATAPTKAAVKQLLARADAHYRAADGGIPMLPRSCRLAIASSRQIYSAIGRAIAKNDHDSVRSRAYVSLSGKLVLVGRALPAVFSTKRPDTAGPADSSLAPLLRSVGLPA